MSRIKKHHATEATVMLKNIPVSAHNFCTMKNVAQILATLLKSPYLCIRYPENSLFTLKKRLIPIEAKSGCL